MTGTLWTVRPRRLSATAVVQIAEIARRAVEVRAIPEAQREALRQTLYGVHTRSVPLDLFAFLQAGDDVLKSEVTAIMDNFWPTASALKKPFIPAFAREREAMVSHLNERKSA